MDDSPTPLRYKKNSHHKWGEPVAFKKAFEYLTAEDQKAMTAWSERLIVPAGDEILEQDTVHDGLFVVADGVVRVFRSVSVMRYRLPPNLTPEQREQFLKNNPDCGEKSRLKVTLGLLGRHAIFGELSFLDGLTTSASVIAESPVSLIRLKGDGLRAMIEADDSFAARFYHSLALSLSGRVRQINKQRLTKDR